MHEEKAACAAAPVPSSHHNHADSGAADAGSGDHYSPGRADAQHDGSHRGNHDSGEAVTQQDVFALVAAHTERLKAMLAGVVADLPDPAGCTCETWADGVDLTYDVP